jgi:hypothetical protein
MSFFTIFSLIQITKICHLNSIWLNNYIFQNKIIFFFLYIVENGPLPKLCPAVVLSRQDGRHSAVALLLKAALIHVSDYRLLGASCL